MYREIIIEKLKKMIDINIPIIYINDFDTIRINSIIFDAFQDKDIISEWNSGVGLTNFWYFNSASSEELNPKEILDNLVHELSTRVQSTRVARRVFILREIQDYINEAPVKSLLAAIAQRKLYDLDFDLTIIIVSSVVKVPEELLPYVSFLDIEYPNDDEIRNIIYRHVFVNENEAADDDLKDKNESQINEIVKEYILENHKSIIKQVDSLLPNFRGMMPFDIDRMVDMAMSRNGTLGADDYQMVLEHKKQLVKKSGVLELVESQVDIDDIGGLENLKRYIVLKSIIRNNSKDASDNGIAMPKGFFLVGMPGCGKSLSAQVTASVFKEPLLKLDMGTLMGSKVGESEKNLRKAIKIAEAAAPCVLWVDEIEKGFSGSAKDDNAYLRRMFGYFLSWLQDKKSAVFVLATANNLGSLPTEFKRKGRFDDMFFVDLPNKEECMEIFNIKIKKVMCKQLSNKHYKKEDIFEVSEESDLVKYVADEKKEGHHFCGADIEYVVNKAFEMIFRKKTKREIISRLNREINDIQNDSLKVRTEMTDLLLKQKQKELDSMQNGFDNSLNEYQEESIVIPDTISETFLYEIAKKTKCIGMLSDDENVRKMREDSPAEKKEKSPYLSAS